VAFRSPWTTLAIGALLVPMLVPSAPAPSGFSQEAPEAWTGEAGWEEARLVVEFHDGIPEDIAARASANGLRTAHRDAVLGFVVLEGPTAAVHGLLQRAGDWPEVRSVEINQAGPVAAPLEAADEAPPPCLPCTAGLEYAPNDPLYADQWGPRTMGASRAWVATLGSPAVRVAILSTGVDLAHPDLAGNLCGPHASFVPGDSSVQDGYGHGTALAGVVGAVTDNGVGIAGLSQSCLLVVKVLDRSGSGQWPWIASGIRWAADEGADIILVAVAGPSAPLVVHTAVQHAEDRGAVVLAPAGDRGCPGALGSTIGFPAGYDEVLAVAGLEMMLAPAGFSSCGADLELSGPAVGILTTLVPCSSGATLCSSTGYGALTGTTMGAAHAAGAAALLRSFDPLLGGLSLRCLLDLSATDLLLPGRDPFTGWGLVNPATGILMDRLLQAPAARGAFEAACNAATPLIAH
jgi:subtilisin family serine protease